MEGVVAVVVEEVEGVVAAPVTVGVDTGGAVVKQL